MRYEPVDTVAFNDPLRGEISIKDRREYPDYTTFITILINEDDLIDEIASRDEIYGADGEDESYKIVDNNIVKLFEADFNLIKLTKLEIPV